MRMIRLSQTRMGRRGVIGVAGYKKGANFASRLTTLPHTRMHSVHLFLQ
jgi:hypothetical protein